MIAMNGACKLISLTDGSLMESPSKGRSAIVSDVSEFSGLSNRQSMVRCREAVTEAEFKRRHSCIHSSVHKSSSNQYMFIDMLRRIMHASRQDQYSLVQERKGHKIAWNQRNT